jgi:hypothetical protein
MLSLFASIAMTAWVVSQARLKLEGGRLFATGVFAFLLTWVLTGIAENLGTALLRTGPLAYALNMGSLALTVAALVAFFRWRIRAVSGNSKWSALASADEPSSGVRHPGEVRNMIRRIAYGLGIAALVVGVSITALGVFIVYSVVSSPGDDNPIMFLGFFGAFIGAGVSAIGFVAARSLNRGKPAG